MPLISPAIKTSQTAALEKKKAKNLWMSRHPTHILLTSHLLSQIPQFVCGPPLPSGFDAQAP